jgi:PhnB protein
VRLAALSFAGAAAAIDFYITVLAASERLRIATPGGVIAHAESRSAGR